MSFQSIKPRFGSGGRGTKYGFRRGLLESTLRIAYVGGWPARLWGRVPTASRVRVVRHQLKLWGGLARPLRIAFASDFHFGPTTSTATLDAAFEALRSVDVDVLLLGGDYVFLDINAELAAELSRRIASVPAPIKLAVLGNHDLWTDTAVIERALTHAGVRVLVNDAVTLPEPFADVAILGLDDAWTGSPDPERALAAAGSAPHRLAISHSPDGAPFLENRSVSFLFCGHTHGGQIALPGERPIVLPAGPYSKRFAAGLFQLSGLGMFVSRGIGATELPMRFYAPSEIAVFEVS